jgi:hypothetical protein
MAIVCQPAVESLDALKSLAPSAYYRSATDDLSGPWLGDTGIDLLEDLTTSWTALLADNWDSYGAERPSDATRENTLDLLRRLKRRGFAPSAVIASAEGGIATYFFNASKTAYVEFRNSGEIIAAMYDADSDPIVREFVDKSSSWVVINEIGGYLNS